MKKIPYNCKFCNTPGETQIDEFDGFQVQLVKWIPYLACNRCSKFYEAKRSKVEAIAELCHTLIHTRYGKPSEKDAIESAIRTKLSNRLDEYSTLVCDYLRIETVSDPIFLESIFSDPKQFGKMLGIYFANLRKAYPNQFQPHND